MTISAFIVYILLETTPLRDLLCTGWSWADFQSGCTGDCSTNAQNTGFLEWLRATCGSVPGFNGLPSDWQDLVYVTNSTFIPQTSFAWPSCLSSSNSSDRQSIVSGCSSDRCASVDSNRNCLSVTAIDLGCLCPQVKYGTNMLCGGGTDNTGLLWWLNGTCANVEGFNGLPSNWEDLLVVTNETYPTLSSFASWPTCLNSGDYPDCQLNNSESSCTSLRCSPINPEISCNSVQALDVSCFCPKVQYGINCTTSNCISWMKRAQYLYWLDDACSALGSGTSLLSNWTSLLSVQRGDMLPWNWKLTSDLPPSADSHCPSASKKLLAFAVVNIIMAALIPFIGRQTVIKKLTCGYFGRQESRKLVLYRSHRCWTTFS